MKLPSLPPLNALHVFAVAGRQLSFKRAAELLHVSPGAVSQQIKLLEDHLGCPLFIRRNRVIELTDEGSRLLLPLREAFQAMVDAVDEVSTARAPHVLMVSVLPSFAALWLVPRLGKFRRQHPDIEVMINATPRLVALSQEHVDMGIRCGLGRYPGLHVEWLLPADRFPVCSPRLMKGRNALKQPGDLKHHTLVHDEFQTHWEKWLKTYGVTGVSAKRGPVFSDANLALQAALDGQGVALISHALTESALARGALVRPFDLALASSVAYYVVCEAGREVEPAIRAFREWIVAEAQNILVAGKHTAKLSPDARASDRTTGAQASTLRRSRHARAS